MEPLELHAHAATATEDIKSALQYYFRTLNAKQRFSEVLKRPSRRHVFGIVQVRKKANNLLGKRLGASLGKDANSKAGKGSAYALCISVCLDNASRDASCQPYQKQTAQIHYLKFHSSFLIEMRQTWELEKLDSIEVLSESSVRGAFALQFQREEPALVWTVQSTELDRALTEFIWSICALGIDQSQNLPRLIRVSHEELDDYAVSHNLYAKYNLKALKLATFCEHGATANNSEMPNIGLDRKNFAHALSADAKSPNAGLHHSIEENEDLLALFADVKWGESDLEQVEEDLKRKLRDLEDENISFLLSFESDQMQATKPLPSVFVDKSKASVIGALTPVDRILRSIEALEGCLTDYQSWSKGSDDEMAKISQNMVHFESLNNQLEVHFKNSVALQMTLENLLSSTSVPEEKIRLLQSPSTEIFTSDCSKVSEIPHSTKILLENQLKPMLDAVHSVGQALQACADFPACDMSAFRDRAEELKALVHTFSEHVSSVFQQWLQRLIKAWRASDPLQISVDVLNGSSHGSTSMSDDASTLQKNAIVAPRQNRFGTSSASDEACHVNWTLTNEQFHAAIKIYKPLFAAIGCIDAKELTAIRQTYIKSVSQVYTEHLHNIFRYMREHLAKPSGTKSLQPWGIQHSSSHIRDVLSASRLFQQALDHLLPLILREEHFVSLVLLYPGTTRTSRNDSSAIDGPATEDLHFVMDSIFEKSTKRFVEFGELAASRNIVDAVALVVLINLRLPTCQTQCEYLHSVLLHFQLQMKRILSKFNEEQESWIQSQHPDTKMAGVLKPVQKIISIVERLMDSVDGNFDDSTLVSILNRLIPTLLQWLDKVAELKPEFIHLVKLENYHFIYERLHAQKLNTGNCLIPYLERSKIIYEENLTAYVERIWELELKQLAPLMEQLQKLLETVPPHEIQFHTSRQDASKYFKALCTSFEKIHVREMYERVKRHFQLNHAMLPIVWDKFIAHAHAQFRIYEHIGSQCYQLTLEPTPQAAKEMMQAIADTSRMTNSKTEQK